AEAGPLGHRAPLPGVLDLAVLGVVHGLPEAAPRRLLVDLGATRLATTAHHVYGRFLSAHQLPFDRVDQALLDQGLESLGRFHGHHFAPYRAERKASGMPCFRAIPTDHPQTRQAAVISRPACAGRPGYRAAPRATRRSPPRAPPR